MSENPELDRTIVESPSPRQPRDDGPKAALVEGSGPALSSAMNDLLRDRLKIASVLIFSGSTAFFALGLILPGPISGWYASVVYCIHLSVVTFSGLMAFRLCTNCPFVHSHLRVTEWLLFGLPVLLFATSDSACLFHPAEAGDGRPIAQKWILLIFIYAMFIPNQWRRAMWPIAGLSVFPVIVALLAGSGLFGSAASTRLAETTHSQTIEIAMLMLITGSSATWGVYTINSLREEAFEAKRLGQYQLQRQIGAGGMGEVYLAEHVLLKRPCAIKVIRPGYAGNSQVLARFEREVRATSRLTHWNTVEIFDYGRAEDGTFYYVMEYLPGMNLDQLVAMHGPLPPDRVIHFLTQICEALQEAHAADLIHRDIKPANIFAAHRGGVFDVAKLLDFGLARPVSAIRENGLTQEGTITGSPLYTSPEQAVGDPADERSDIYSVGAVAWWLLTGRPLFDDQNPMKVLVAHATGDPGRPSDLNDEIPSDLERIILRCLEKKPNDRFQSVTELRKALLSCDEAAHWTREDAAAWWQGHGCPQKKQLDQEVLADLPTRTFHAADRVV